MFCLYSHLSPMCMQCLQEPEEGIRSPRKWSYRWLWILAQVLGMQPGSFARAVSAPKSWAISPALTFSFFIPPFFLSTFLLSPFKGKYSLLVLTQLPYLIWQGTRVWMGVVLDRRTPSQASGLWTGQSTTLQSRWPSLSLIYLLLFPGDFTF